MIDNKVRSCSEAAVGLEQATRSIRPPDTTIVQDMRARCETDRWPEAAIDCFATMTEGSLSECALKLPEDNRRGMFATLGGDESTAIAIARVRLTTMHVGVPACDQLFATTRELLACERIPVEQRALLGPQIADLWNLPAKLPPDAEARMAGVCQQTLDELGKQAHELGCN